MHLAVVLPIAAVGLGHPHDSNLHAPTLAPLTVMLDQLPDVTRLPKISTAIRDGDESCSIAMASFLKFLLHEHGRLNDATTHAG